MNDRLVLFDIDGTLLSAGDSGLIALETAAREVLGIQEGLRGISVHGNTDRNVLAAMCRREGRALPDENDIARFRDCYLAVLRDRIARMGFLMPGVRPLLDALLATPGVRLGLVTGNFRAGAYVKLARFGLAEAFPDGAFGDDLHETRADLVRLAFDRLTAQAEPVPPWNRTIVIGDTEHDVRSCHPHGARSLGVATGETPVAALEAAGADLAVADLSETGHILNWILS